MTFTLCKGGKHVRAGLLYTQTPLRLEVFYLTQKNFDDTSGIQCKLYLTVCPKYYIFSKTSGKIQLNEDDPKHQDPHQEPQEPQEDQGHPSRQPRPRPRPR